MNNMKQRGSINVIGFFLLLQASQIIAQGSEKSLQRSKRFLGLFNVVQFANDVCNSTSSDGEQGSCFTSTECANKGGRSSGSCAQGFGVCCIFDYSCRRNGESSGQDVIYFKNEDFPQATSTPTMCIFSINIKDDTICQLRLDFEEFILDGGSALDKPCDRDAMEIFTGGSGDLGNGRLCGRNTGQHLYIPVENDRVRPMIRIITDGRLGGDDTFVNDGYKFSVKITQIDCSSRDENQQRLRAPPGCLQYFTERQGTVSSFNWDPVNPRQYVPDQHYSLCFRRVGSDCRLELKRSRAAPPFSTSVGRAAKVVNANIYSPTVCGPENGCGVAQCSVFDTNGAQSKNFNDYLLVPGAYRKSNTNNNNVAETYVMASHFCGAGIGRDDTTTGTNEVNGIDDGTGVFADGPLFTVTFHADNNPGALDDPTVNNNNNMEVKSELGFSLDYRVTSSCPDLVFVNL